MPIEVSYPGVYVEEIPGVEPTVPGVSTASTAFVDFFSRGPMETPTLLFSMADVNRDFGGLHAKSEASYALQQYFLNGGQQAWVVRTGDGTARKSRLDVEVKTPGLATRYLWASEYSELADEAQQAAHKAAEAANEALQALQGDITDQERQQGLLRLQASTDTAGDQTSAAAQATRDAAAEAKASSDELAIAIAKLAAGSGPVASRTSTAARNSAKAAEASANAAKQSPVIIGAAQQVAVVAGQALKTGAAARTAKAAAEQLLTVLDGVSSAAAAARTAEKKNTEAQQSTDKTAAEQAAVSAAMAAEKAAEQAEAAVESVLLAVQTVRDHYKSEEGADDKLAAAEADVTSAEALDEPVQKVAKAAGGAAWDAQTCLALEDAQAAAQAAADAASQALAVTEGEKGAKTLATSALKSLLAMASEAATEGAASADKEAAERTAVGSVVEKAILAINEATDAAKAATVAANKTADDAKVAASCVGSAAVNMAAREVVAGSHKRTKEAADAFKQTKAIALQVNQANMTALLSVKPATEAAAKATEVAGALAEADPDSIKVAVDTAQAALNAANNAVAAAEGLEKAAVAASQVAVEASLGADLAANAAHVAVDANEEASRPPTLRIEAANEGVWGDNIQIEIVTLGTNFSLAVREMVTQRGVTKQVNGETYNSVNLEVGDKKNAIEVVNGASSLISLEYIGPLVSGAFPAEVDGKFLGAGEDGGLADAMQLTGADGAMMSLEYIAPYIFNLMCIPAIANLPDAQAFVAIANVQAYCQKKRAFFICDISQNVDSVDKMLGWTNTYQSADAYHMAVYYPRLVMPDPLQDYRPKNVGVSGTMAGIYARTDSMRGIWKAPAGIGAVVRGAQVTKKLTDTENGLLNPRGVNVVRSFPIYGTVTWGARTLAGADALSSEYKYINVRRLTNFIEESLFQGLKWAVFEPNDQKLWSTISLQVATFLSGLFSDGAFRGADSASSYFVLCDGTTTTPLDVDLGLVNIKVGIAPSKPAEFVVLEIQQMAGQAA